jgi:hypothetical protein
MSMESVASPPFENLPNKEINESKGMTEIGGGEEQDDCYEIDFTDNDDDDEDDDKDNDDDDDDEAYCYVIDHSNHGEHYVISHCEVIEDEGYENGDEDEYDDSDYDDDDDDNEKDDEEEDDDDSDDDSCYEIDPTDFSPKISIQVPDNPLAT